MTIVGPANSKSRARLQALVETIQCTTPVSWGVENPNYLNGQHRLDAWHQSCVLAADEVPHVPTTNVLREAQAWVREGHLVFGRLLLHTQGRDIVGPRHPQWPRREYWTKVIPNVEQEWRIHVFRGRSIARGLKVATGPQWRKLPVRNRSNGWTMVHTEDPPQMLRDIARLAVAAVGYDFGAVDLLYTTDHEALVLEVNKAPGLDDYTAGQYAAALTKWAHRRA